MATKLNPRENILSKRCESGAGTLGNTNNLGEFLAKQVMSESLKM